jgi:chorismate--pyruvate lyase
LKHDYRKLRSKREPRWLPSEQAFCTGVPEALQPWLLDSSSLTHRLQQACSGLFQVEVVQQRWELPMRNERLALGMRVREYGLVRHVRLLCDGRACVFARTVIPRRTLRGAQRRLSKLGSKPLGAVLFADTSMRRGGLELARIRAGELLFQMAVCGLGVRPPEIWGRRSVFYLGKSGKPLLVNEIFLPGMKDCGGG